MSDTRSDGMSHTLDRTVNQLRRLWGDDDGTTGLEYALLLMLVALSALVAWRSMGDAVALTVQGSTGQVQAGADLMIPTGMR